MRTKVVKFSDTEQFEAEINNILKELEEQNCVVRGMYFTEAYGVVIYSSPEEVAVAEAITQKQAASIAETMLSKVLGGGSR